MPLKELVIECKIGPIAPSSILQTMSLSVLTKLVVTWQDSGVGHMKFNDAEFSQLIMRLPQTIVNLVILLGPGISFFTLERFVSRSSIDTCSSHFTSLFLVGKACNNP